MSKLPCWHFRLHLRSLTTMAAGMAVVATGTVGAGIRVVGTAAVGTVEVVAGMVVVTAAAGELDPR